MMLVAVSRQIRTMRATIVATYREVEVKHLPELAALITEAEREGLVLPLRGLGETDIGEFVERTWGVRAASSLVHQLRDMTEGNPFFLHEVLRQMAADGQLAGGEPAGPALLNIPRGVSEFIKRLTQPLPDEARQTLDVASVLGREFSLNALAAATGKPPDALIDVLDRAVALELIGETRGAGPLQLPPCVDSRSALRRPSGGAPPRAASRRRRGDPRAERGVAAVRRDRLPLLPQRLARRRRARGRLFAPGRARGGAAVRL